MENARARLIAQELQFVRSRPSRPLYFHGTSMEPLLREGDEVAIEAVTWDEIHRGDIVTYRFEDKFPMRRVVAKGSDRLFLACDNWPTPRFEAHRDAVLGRATGRRRAGSWLRATDPEWRRARRAALGRHRPALRRHALMAWQQLLVRLGLRKSGHPIPR